MRRASKPQPRSSRASCIGLGGRDGDQQAAGRLRVEQNGAQLLGHGRRVFDHALGEVAIGLQSARDHAGANAFQRTAEQRHLGGADLKRDVAGHRQLARMADQSEAGDVGHAVHRVAQRRPRRRRGSA